MPNSFASHSNAQSIEKSPNERTATKNQARLLIVGPEGLRVEELQVLKESAEKMGVKADGYRTCDGFQMSELRSEIRDSNPPFTHLILGLDELPGFDDGVLYEADMAKIRKIAFFCVHSDASLTHHVQRLKKGQISLIMVRNSAQHSRVGKWHCHCPQTLLVEDMSKDAARIAELFIGTPEQRGWEYPSLAE